MPDPVVETTPAEATPSAPSAAPAATPPAASAAAPAPAATPSTAPPVGQEGWVPPYRLREVREQGERALNEARQQWENSNRGEIQRLQQQIAALTGVQAPAPNQAENDAIMDQFGRLFPNLARFNQLDPERIEQLLAQAQGIQQQQEHYWQNYGRQSLDRLFGGIKDAIGSDLTDEAKRIAHTSFLGWVSSSPELTARYEQDPTIVDDFVRAYTNSFIDPVRRQATATVAARVPSALPQDRPGGVPPIAGLPKTKDLDELANRGWAAYRAIKDGNTP